MSPTKDIFKNLHAVIRSRLALVACIVLALMLAMLWNSHETKTSAGSAPLPVGPAILCSTGDGWCQQALISALVPGATVTRWTSAQFQAANVAAFQQFDIIYLDHRFSNDAAVSVKNIYGAAIDGRAVITGQHFEHCNTVGSRECNAFRDSINWIYAGGGTGILVSTQINASCANWIPSIPPFNGISYSVCGGAFDIVRVDDPGHGTMATATNASLSNFNQSAHSIFNTIGGFTSVASVCHGPYQAYAGGNPASQCSSIGGTMRPHILVTSIAVADQDGDGVPDSSDNCPTVANPSQTDANGNGVGDACEAAPTVTISPATASVLPGGSVTFTTVAADADHPVSALTYEWRINGIIQPTRTSPTETFTFLVDSVVRVTVRDPGLLSGFDESEVTINLDRDADGIPDLSDNCPEAANAGQEDSDNDGIGDACDSAPSCPGIAPPANMTNWWPGDGDATDIVGGNDGTLQNGATFAAGKVGQAFSFDGINDFVSVPGTYGGGTEATVDAWVRTSATTGDFQAIVSSTDFTFVHLQLNNPSGPWNIVVYTNTGRVDLPIVPQTPVGVWRHLAFTIKPGDSRLYLDGQQIGQNSQNFSQIIPTSNLRIGSGFANGRFFKGEIDEVEIFNRALTSAEVLALYNAGAAGKCKDTDGDTVPDATDNCPLTPNPDQLDTDDDGQGDACDADDDNDGIPDSGDNCPPLANPDQVDTDADGQGDACDTDDDGDGVTDGVDNCPLTSNSGQEDNDADGIGDACDADDDNDTISDGVDNCPLAANTNQADNDSDGIGDACDPDDDNDGVADGSDNCQFTANPSQSDNDADGIGDACDADDDNDTVPDGVDNCPLTPNSDQTDTDADGLGNACDPDDDNDGHADGVDNCSLTPNPEQADLDNDGVGDACDPDDDGDDVPDTSDNCPRTPNPDQRDTNGDGVGDACTPFQWPAGGSFVIGDLVSNAGGAAVYFWGSQWLQNNPMTIGGGPGTNSFKGFENGLGTPTCGGTWTSQPGNSTPPPGTVPAYMAVIVSSQVNQSGPVLSGDVKRIVIVRTNADYGPSPGHVGTGRVIAILCEAP